MGQCYCDVLANPDGDDHQNIRNIMKYGWNDVIFESRIVIHSRRCTGSMDSATNNGYDGM